MLPLTKGELEGDLTSAEVLPTPNPSQEGNRLRKTPTRLAPNSGRISGLGERLLTLMQAIVLGYSGFVVIPPANELRATSENPLKWVKRIVNKVPSVLAGDGIQPISMGFLCSLQFIRRWCRP